MDSKTALNRVAVGGHQWMSLDEKKAETRSFRPFL